MKDLLISPDVKEAETFLERLGAAIAQMTRQEVNARLLGVGKWI